MTSLDVSSAGEKCAERGVELTTNDKTAEASTTEVALRGQIITPLQHKV